VAVVLTLVQKKQIRTNIHKQNDTKKAVQTIQNSKYKYTYYQNTHTLQNKLKQTQFLYGSLHTLFLVCILYLHALIVCISSPFSFYTLSSPFLSLSSPFSFPFSVFVFLSFAFYIFPSSGVFLFLVT
jgi:hypothetical protein